MAKKKECCKGHGMFPIIAVVVLLLGVLWLLGDLGVITAKVPWLPIVVIAIAINWLMHFYAKK